MARYQLTDGKTVETSYPAIPGAIAFETKGPDGEVVSNVTKYGKEATDTLRDLMLAAALRRVFA
ncbi:hypothetical protein [Streptomyces globisporus]|uniref:hypothetical protein n=1 Tax=Streptomyces globisporus TaxID=1908 RepID=UPI00381D0DDA